MHLVLLSLLFLAALVIGLVLILGAILNGEWIGAVVVLVDVAGLFGVLMLAPSPLLRFTDQGVELRRQLSGLHPNGRAGSAPDAAVSTGCTADHRR